MSATQSDIDSKRAKKKARTDALYFGYTNEANPFNDNELRNQFVWHKNDDGQSSQSKKERRKQQEEVVEQIEKVKERRKEREAERAEFERLKLEQERLEQQDEAAEFFEKEKQFHQQQVYKRTLVRIQDERTAYIDVIARNIVVLETLKEKEGEITGIHSQKSEFIKHFGMNNIETRTIGSILKSILQEDFEHPIQAITDILTGLAIFVEAESTPQWKQYWLDATTIITNCLAKKRDGLEPTRGIHSCVCEDVVKQINSKDLVELEAMRSEMMTTSQGVDMEFDEAIYRLLSIRQANLRVSSTSTQVVTSLQEIVKAMPKPKTNVVALTSTVEENTGPSEEEKKLLAEVASKPLEEGEDRMGEHNEVDAGPSSHSTTNDAPKTAQEAMAQGSSSSSSSSSHGGTTKYRDHGPGQKGSFGEDGKWKHPPGWGYKYRSRKPQYLNRVKSGYDWNKYNRAHYDRDNPPPKTVQGYKFNVFYPDLMDNSKTPLYKLEAADTQDFCIIRFSAGPPYEDLAFKIVNKEWEIGKRAGFKSTFQRGILQLHFNFKRSRYRR